MPLYKDAEWRIHRTQARRLFLEELARQMMKPNIEMRALNPVGLNTHVRRAIEATGVTVKRAEQPRVPPAQGRGAPQNIRIQGRKRGRCHICPRQNDKKYDVMCDECDLFVCKEHRLMTKVIKCSKCAEE